MNAKWGFSIVAAAFTVSCSPVGSAELNECRSVVSRYFGKPPREVVTAFEASDLETKYRIYLCGNQAVHPPALYLAAEFAKGGEDVATILRRKLEKASSDVTVRDIVRVYGEMQRQGTYDVRTDAQLMKLLSDRVQSVRDEYWRKYCAKILSEINGG